MTKRYYWLKLKENFFLTPHVKALRKLPGGSELCIIYLKMMLQSIKNNGILLHTLSSNSFSDELSILLDEEKNSIELVLHFLTINELLEKIEDKSYLLLEAENCIGSESSSAEKMRRKREKDKQILQISEKSHCDQNVTLDKEKDIDNNNNIEMINNSKNFNTDYSTPKGDLNNKELDAVVDALKKIDIKEDVATELYKKYGKDVILLALKDMQGRKGIYRPGGYLIKMLQEKWPVSKNTIEQMENVKKQKEKEELQLYKEKASKFCSSCTEWESRDIFCSHDGMRLDKNTFGNVKCEFCKVENE